MTIRRRQMQLLVDRGRACETKKVSRDKTGIHVSCVQSTRCVPSLPGLEPSVLRVSTYLAIDTNELTGYVDDVVYRYAGADQTLCSIAVDRVGDINHTITNYPRTNIAGELHWKGIWKEKKTDG